MHIRQVVKPIGADVGENKIINLFRQDLGKKTLLGAGSILEMELGGRLNLDMEFVSSIDTNTGIAITYLQMHNTAGIKGTLVLQRKKRIDPLYMHRLIRLMQKLPVIDLMQLGLIMSLPYSWNGLKKNEKKGVSRQIGVRKSDINIIVGDIPKNLRGTISDFIRHNVPIDASSIQRDVLANKITFTSQLRTIGVLSVEQMRKEEIWMEEMRRRYGKYVRKFFSAEFQKESPENEHTVLMYDNFVLEAIDGGIKDKDIIIGYAFYKIVKWRLSAAANIVNVCFGITLNTVAGAEHEVCEMRLKDIAKFLKGNFHEKGRTVEEYVQTISKLTMG